ncbi:MAG: recombinase family protein [Patescibacteria group bacterium]
MNMENQQKVAIYARVSTDEQREGHTIQSQLNELRKYAQENNFLVSNEYLDDGWSGSLLDRPALDRMRDDADKSLFEAVLVNDVDRLARDIGHIIAIRRDLENKGKQIIFRKLPNNNHDANGNLMINMMSAFAEYEREVILDRTRRGKRNKVENMKLILGGIPPYGYDYIKRDKDNNAYGFYKINLKETNVVKRIFNLVDQKGYSARQIVRWLTENNIPPREGNTKWARSSVLRILKRTEYIGIAFYNKYEAVEPHSPKDANKYKRQKKNGRRLRDRTEWIQIPVPQCRIISDEQFNRVQLIIKNNKVFAKRNTKHSYLLAKLLYCQCGSLFVGCPMHDKPYYRCNSRDKDFPLTKTCNAHSIRSNEVDNKAWESIKRMILEPELLESKIDKYRNWAKKQGSVKLPTPISTDKEIKKLTMQDERIFSAYRDGAISLPKYKEEANKIKQKISELGKSNTRHNELNPPDIRINATRSVEQLRSKLRAGLELVDHDAEEKQKIIRLLVEKGELIDKLLTLNIRIPANIVNTTC